MPSISSNDSRISIGNTWGDSVTQPIPSEKKRRHAALSWRECTNDDCKVHKSDKEGANYWPRDPKKRKASVRSTDKGKESFGPRLSNEDSGSSALPDIPYLSEYAPPIRMHQSIIETPADASPAFQPLYSEPF